MAFLRAQWRDLLLVNWAVDPARVAPWVPAGCAVDLFERRTFASLVAFRFLDTRVLGVRWPGHTNFEEVNLRLYVRRPVVLNNVFDSGIPITTPAYSSLTRLSGFEGLNANDVTVTSRTHVSAGPQQVGIAFNAWEVTAGRHPRSRGKSFWASKVLVAGTLTRKSISLASRIRSTSCDG